MMRKTIMLVFALLVLSLSLTHAQTTPKTVVLVHGAFQDATGWSAVIENLTAQGITAVAVELAGRGDDNTLIADIHLETYRDQVIQVVEAQAQPVILVGHSFGGMVISAVAEAIPDKIEALVYLAAYLPRDGESLVTLSSNDHYSVLGQEGNFIVAPDYSVASVLESTFAPAFCPDCSEAQLATVAQSQLDEPLAPLNEPVTLTAEKFGSVQKVYILTAQDVVVSPQLQALMIANTPVDKVYALNSGHAPYISMPDALAQLLGTIGS